MLIGFEKHPRSPSDSTFRFTNPRSVDLRLELMEMMHPFSFRAIVASLESMPSKDAAVIVVESASYACPSLEMTALAMN